MNLIERLRHYCYEPEFAEAADRIEQLEAEVLEQCRLNGMGAEREAALLGRIEQLECRINELSSKLK